MAKVKPIFAWYDLWIGVFWDQRKRKLYILPVPCFGVVIDFNDYDAAKGFEELHKEFGQYFVDVEDKEDL